MTLVSERLADLRVNRQVALLEAGGAGGARFMVAGHLSRRLALALADRSAGDRLHPRGLDGPGAPLFGSRSQRGPA